MQSKYVHAFLFVYEYWIYDTDKFEKEVKKHIRRLLKKYSIYADCVVCGTSYKEEEINKYSKYMVKIYMLKE